MSEEDPVRLYALRRTEDRPDNRTEEKWLGSVRDTWGWGGRGNLKIGKSRRGVPLWRNPIGRFRKGKESGSPPSEGRSEL